MLTERSEAERASTRRPEESLSAWSQEPARTRGRPAPQRRSALHADTAGAKAPRRLRRARIGPGFEDPTPKRSEAERGVGSEPATGAGTASATDVTWLIYTHIYSIPTQHERPRVSSPPDYVRGRRPGGASVCGRAGARAFDRSRGALQAQNGDAVHGIGHLKWDIPHTLIWEYGPTRRRISAIAQKCKLCGTNRMTPYNQHTCVQNVRREAAEGLKGRDRRHFLTMRTPVSAYGQAAGE